MIRSILILQFIFSLIINKANAQIPSSHEIDSIIILLDTIYNNDQGLRIRDDKFKHDSLDSQKRKELWSFIRIQDSINLMKVEQILDKYGWLSSSTIGKRRNQTLFLVIQHANLTKQIKYLPTIKDAVSRGDAEAKHAAMLEDRILVSQNKKQIFGTQLKCNQTSQPCKLYPLIEPEKIDERRLSVGLDSISIYLKNFGLNWNLKEYKEQNDK
jgi:hypothetical protein